jgi:arylformamidase
LRIIDLTAEGTLEEFLREVHSGTHIEAPAQLLSTGKRLDEFPAQAFMTSAVVLDLTSKGAGEEIDDEDLEAAEEGAGLSIRDGEAVILSTGADEPSKAANHVCLSANGAEFLEFKHPCTVGTDAPSLDRHENVSLPAHTILMRAGILVLEGLCNLKEIEQPRFRLLALPLRIRAASSPVRAVAILDD